MPASGPPKRFRVALSFPGEHRPRVEAIAHLLRDKLGEGKVLYDNWHEAEFARPNLDVYLPGLYHDESELVVFFHCAEYNEKEWCCLEWRAGRDLLKKKQDDRLMFLKLDSAEIPGLLSIDGYLWMAGRPDTEVAGLILQRLALLSPVLPVAAAPPEAYVSKLPATDSTLIGRDDQLATLEDAWTSNANFVQIIAPGGTGKTALMTKWYKRRIAEVPVFGWSFYRQGASENCNVSSDEFFQAAVDWFHLHPTAETADAKAMALVHYLRHNRALLILDGLEPLQDHSNGDLRDLAIKDLLRDLAAQNAGLVLCTTRVRLSDIAGEDGAAVGLELDNLSEADGASYLREHFKVHGSGDELREASRAYGNHALALTLLGTYLRRFGGDISRRFEIDDLPTDNKKPGHHAKRVMRSYWKIFQGRPEGDILRALGFFDRPAERDALKLVLPTMLDENALATLREARLILSDNSLAPIDCHPLVREHFGAVTKSIDPEAFRDGHSRLFDYYCKLPAKEQPDTLEQMAPLFHAVGHGCRAGRYEEARADVYRDRILRGTDEFYLWNTLGAFGTNLALLAHFFETVWSQPASALSAVGQSWVLGEAGLSLRALGRLADAVQPMQASAAAQVKRGDWRNSAIGHNNLCELLLTLGRMPEAIDTGRRSLDYAERSGRIHDRMRVRTTLADALHQSASPVPTSRHKKALAEAGLLFAEAEQIQREKGPLYPPIMPSVAGYRYCDFLLNSLGRAPSGPPEVLRRATLTLALSQEHNLPLEIGLDHLSLGRAYGLGSSDSSQHLDQAIASLRQAGQLFMLPLALLARGADQDLAEVHRIASRSGMRLHLTDYHLAMARRHQSIEHLEKAEKLIQETGYHRRDPEAAALRQQLAPRL